MISQATHALLTVGVGRGTPRLPGELKHSELSESGSRRKGLQDVEGLADWPMLAGEASWRRLCLSLAFKTEEKGGI